MRKEISYTPIAILVILLASMFTVIPVSAFIHPDGTVDTNSELFGPHVDQIQFKMYGTTDAMWGAMDQGLIDLCDWPLTTSWRQTFALNPDVNVVSAGGEAGLYTIDFNEDPYAIVPESTRPGYENPVYTKATPGYPLGIPPISSNVHFRWACLKLFNRTLYNQILGPAGFPILTPVPSYMGGYIWPAPAPPAAPDYVAATTELNAGGIYKTITGVWYWDYDGSGQTNSPPQNEIDACNPIMLTYRLDTYRTQAGVQLYTELENMGFVVDHRSLSGGQNYQQVMLDKNYHITTLGWIYIGPDPDYLYDLYHVTAFYDDPESSCSNTADLNDTTLNTAAEGIKYALTPEAALAATLEFQQRFYAICAQIPLHSSARYGANAKYYTGGNDGVKKAIDDGENQYRLKNQTDPTSRREWLGFANQAGVGSNTWFSEVNAYPNCTPYGTNDQMTLRYGWSSQDYPKHINPFYSEWYWDSMVLGVMYDSMGYRDPYDVSQWKPDLVKNWTVGTWFDANANKSKSKVQVTLRPDLYWSDGNPMTIADVVFSLVESAPLLIEKGNSPPWWWPTAELVKSLTIIDPYTVEILYDVASYFALSWTIGGFYIVPKHIWKPLILSGAPMNSFAPDPNFICSGPFRYLQYTPQSSIVMVANTANRTITTDRAGAVPITSTKAYHNYCPVYVNVHNVPSYASRLFVDSVTKHGVFNFDVTIMNKWLNDSQGGNLAVAKYLYVDGVLQATFPYNIDVGTNIESLSYDWNAGKHNITVAVLVYGPAMIDDVHVNPWIGQWINVTQRYWVTIKQDISGTTLHEQLGLASYLYKTEVPCGDIKVDVKDVAAAAKAFGTQPGDSRWSTVADITGDYKVDVKDIASIAKKYGWLG